MAMAEAITEEPLTEPRAEPTFLKTVAQMATLAEEAIRKLRTEVHPDSFTFKKLDLSPLFPQTVNSLDYLGRLETVVSNYLAQTARFGLSEIASFRSGTSIEENTTSYSPTITEWMKNVYTPRKAEIDARVDALSKDISDYANLRARDAAFALSTHSNDENRFIAVAGKPNLNLDNLLAGTLAELKTRFYETELPHPEDLAKLYELCFNAEVKQRDWEELDDKKLAEALAQENVPVEMFVKYTGREVKLIEEKSEGKTGIIIDIINRPAQDDDAGSRTSALIAGVPKQYHFISAPNYFTALEQLRSDCASDPNSLQPTITIAGRNYVRPPTVKEIMQLRLEDYNTLTNPDGTPRTEEERKQLLNKWFFTCSGIAYSTNGNFKLSREVPQLVTMDSVPTTAYLPVNYANLNQNNNWQEFARDQSGVKYNTALTEEEVVAHPVWRYLADDNSMLLRETHQLNCSLYNRSAAMHAWLLDTPKQCQLRALALSSFSNSSYVGISNLNDYSSFLRVARRS